jgi:hypothetical protein
MIRPFTLLCLAACCGSGLYLYTEKHRAELLDRQIAHVIHATEAARQTTSLLRAEWGLLNNPDRLRPMAAKYLALTPMQPSQWVQVSDLGARLPAVVPPGQTGGTDDGTVVAGDSPAGDVPVVAAPADPGIRDVPAPALVATAKPAAPNSAPHIAAAAARPSAKLVAHAAPKRPPPVTVADRDDGFVGRPLAHSAPLPLATPQPSRARVMSAMARPMRVTRPAVVVSTAVPSALGVRTAVPAPVPYGVQ